MRSVSGHLLLCSAFALIMRLAFISGKLRPRSLIGGA